jgi:hypothetical protein
MNSSESNYNNVNNILKEFLMSLKEEDLYEPIQDLLIIQGYKVRKVHGTHERGKDFIATEQNNKYNLLISVKAGDISKSRWTSEVSSSIDQMIKRPINYIGIDETIPRKIMLITNGYLTPEVAGLIDDLNIFNKKYNFPELVVLDLATITHEFSINLNYIQLIGKKYNPSLQRILHLITENSFDKESINMFINTYLSLEQNEFLSFKLMALYILRKSQQKNIYAFFYFAEFLLVKLWSLIRKEKAFFCLNLFDSIHAIYLSSLEDWTHTINYEDYGLLDEESNNIDEIVHYHFRTFDVIRRISYIIFYYLKNKQKDKCSSYQTKLLKIIRNNKSSNNPLCEFHANDIGLCIYVLHKLGNNIEVLEWLFNLMDFLIFHYSLGYQTVSNNEVNKIWNFLFTRRGPKPITSYLLSVLLEFIIILDASEIYNIFRTNIPLSTEIYEIIGPDDESFIYEKDYIQGKYCKLNIEIDYSFFKKYHLQNTRDKQPCYSPLLYHRPYVLILTSNVYRDRHFPQIWRYNE